MRDRTAVPRQTLTGSDGVRTSSFPRRPAPTSFLVIASAFVCLHVTGGLVPAAAVAGPPPQTPGMHLRSSALLGIGIGIVSQSQTQRFWVRDTHHYTSPWFEGSHRKMVPFGCTRAPYYDPDPGCAHGNGFHHGIDIAMPCGNPLYAGARARVVDPASAGSLGPAYGPHAFRLRIEPLDEEPRDIVIGHVRQVFVQPGDVVKPGQLIAKASDAGAPDGCHLHFEVRPRGGDYTSALSPYQLLGLQRAG